MLVGLGFMTRQRFTPGGSPAAAHPGVGVVKMVLRLVAGTPDLADALADLAGIDVRGGSVPKVAKTAAHQLAAGGDHDYRNVSEADRQVAHEHLVALLGRAARSLTAAGEGRDRLNLAIAAGPEPLCVVLREFEPAPERGPVWWTADREGLRPWWGQNRELGWYYRDLLGITAAVIVDWAHADPDTRDRVLLTTGSYTFKTAERLQQQLTAIDAAVTEIHDHATAVTRPSPAWIGSQAWAELTALAPYQLQERDDEIRLMTRHATDTGPSWPWMGWRAEGQAGKTALMTWFAVHAPATTHVVAFTISQYEAGANTTSD